MRQLRFAVAAWTAAGLAFVLADVHGAGQSPRAQGAAAQGAQQGAGEPPAGRQGGGRRGGGAPGGAPIGGTIEPNKPDARGWGWQVKAIMNPATPRPLYNRA